MWIPLSHHLFFACYLFRMLFNFVWLHDFEWVSETHLARPTQLPYLIVETFLTLRLVMHLCFNVIVDCRQQLLLLNFIWTYIKFISFRVTCYILPAVPMVSYGCTKCSSFSPEGHTWRSHAMWQYRKEQNHWGSPLWVERTGEYLCPKWQQAASRTKLV